MGPGAERCQGALCSWREQDWAAVVATPASTCSRYTERRVESLSWSGGACALPLLGGGSESEAHDHLA
jgi:hypothetical protein